MKSAKKALPHFSEILYGGLPNLPRAIRANQRTTMPPGTKSLNSDSDVPCSDKNHLDAESAQDLNRLGITERALLNLQSITDENLLHILARIISRNERLASLISMLILEKQGRYAISMEEWRQRTT